MELPKTWQEYLIWLGIQFPVLVAVGLAARWIIQYLTAQQDRRIAEMRDDQKRLLEEKDKRLAEVVAANQSRLADREKQIQELKDEIEELKAKLTRKPKEKGPSGT
jgi:dephospho-CoA kinase